MKGLYSGVTMKLRYLYPHQIVESTKLSLNPAERRRLSWLDWYHGHGKNARATCRHFGISPDTFYRWKRRFEAGGKKLRTVESHSCRPHRLRQSSIPEEWVEEVYRLRLQDLEKSKYEIQEELRRMGVVLSASSIQRIINRYPQLKNTQHHKKKGTKRWTIERKRAQWNLRYVSPGSLVQCDTKHLYICGKRFFVFAGIDCKTALGFVEAFPTASSKNASQFLEHLVEYFPFPVENVQTDNGSESLKHFHNKCTELDIPHYFSYPHSPKQNGVVERFIQTMQYEFFNWEEDLIPELEYVQEACHRFNEKYNYRRFHQRLNYSTPMEYVNNLIGGNVYGRY